MQAKYVIPGQKCSGSFYFPLKFFDIIAVYNEAVKKGAFNYEKTQF